MRGNVGVCEQVDLDAPDEDGGAVGCEFDEENAEGNRDVWDNYGRGGEARFDREMDGFGGDGEIGGLWGATEGEGGEEAAPFGTGGGRLVEHLVLTFGEGFVG